MAIDDQLASLLAQNADLFATYEEWANGQIMLLAGTVDDPNSFNEAGGKTGALGYYPVVNVSGQTIYVPCMARLRALALGGENAEGFEQLVAQVSGKLTAVDAATTLATSKAGLADEKASLAAQKAAAAQEVVDSGASIVAAAQTVTGVVDRTEVLEQAVAVVRMPDGTQASAIGWVVGEFFHVHTLFRNDNQFSIQNAYLEAIKKRSDLAPADYLTGPEQHKFMVAVLDPTDATKAFVLFGVRSDGSLDSPEYNQLLAEVLGSRSALKQQLQGRKAAYGFALYGLRKALLAARGGGSVDVVLPGDSLTTNIIHLTLRRLFGRLLGFGGPGMLPWHASGLGYDGTSGAITMVAGSWTFWTYNPSTAPTPPAGTTGWDKCWIKSGASAVAGNGQTTMIVNAPFRDRPEYKFDTVRVFFHSVGGDCAFRIRANGKLPDGSTENPGPWVTAVAAVGVSYVDVSGFGVSTGRYLIDIGEQISGSGRLYIGGVCLINSAGGIRFNRQSLGGYKAGDLAGQDGPSQAFYYASLPSGRPACASVHLAHNDSGTDDPTFTANYQIIANRLRTANVDCSLVFTQWFSAAALKREATIRALASAYDATVFDARDVIPSRDWAAVRNLLLAPGTADDPHLLDDGYEHVGHALAIHLGIQTATYNLQGY
jgi:hypothetical protein